MGLILIIFCQVTLLGLTAYVADVSLELVVMAQVVCLCSLVICSYLIEIKRQLKG
jgi:heme A synthase